MDTEIRLITVGCFISECASICESVLVRQVIDACGVHGLLLFALGFLNCVQRLQKSVQGLDQASETDASRRKGIS